MKSLKRLVPRAILAAALAVSAGCGDDDDITGPPGSTARVMAIHASPDAPDVDILVDNVIVADSVAYPSNTGYLNVTPGTRNIKVNVTGTPTTAVELNAPVNASQSYSVFAIDSVASIEALVLVDTLFTPSAGQARVRFVHLASNAPAVDIAVSGGAVLASDMTFRESSGFQTVAAGTYDIEVRGAGTAVVLLPVDDVVLAPGASYTVFVRGFAAGAGDQALGAQVIQNQ